MPAPRLQSPVATPEKILLAAGWGGGKSHNIIDIIKKCLAPSQTMTIIDTESHIQVLLAAAGITPREVWWGGELVEENEDGDQVVLIWARDWDEEKVAIHNALMSAERGDWVAVDSITPPWSDVQSWWIEQVSGGREFGDWFTDTIATNREKGKKDEGSGDMLKEWSPINAQWNQYVLKPLMRSMAHVVVTAHVKSINPEHDDAKTKELWKPFRVKADTQKKVPYVVRTVVGLERKTGAGGGWGGMVLKDPGRTVPGDVPRFDVRSFAFDYLRDIAGWEMVK